MTAASVRATWPVAAVALLTGLVGQYVLDAYWQNALILTLISAIAAMSLTVLLGWGQQAALLTGALMLIGAYLSAGLATRIPHALIWLVCLVVGGAVGAIASVLANRLAGVYLFVGTLGISFILWEGGNLVQSSTGQQAGYFLPALSLFGIQIVDLSRWIWLCVVLFLLVYLYYAYLRRGRFGRAVHLIGHDPALARVAGIPTHAYVRLLFVLTSAITCVAGSLFGFYTQSVSYDTFNLVVSISYIVMVVLGGLGSLPGAVFGAAVVTVAPLIITRLSPQTNGFVAQNLPYLQIVAYAIIGLLILLFLPGGISSIPRYARSIPRALSRRGRRPDSTPAADAESSGDPGALVGLSGVSAVYGGGEVGLVDATVSVPGSGVLSILGRNGAGKTTLLHAIAGFPPGSGGRVRHGRIWMRSDGRSTPLDLTRISVQRRIREGIRLLPTEDKVFPDLTVRDHLVEAIASSTRSDRRMDDVLALFPDLRGKLNSRAGLLSGGERQQLALACGLASHPRLLLVDEASLGLAPVAIRRLNRSLESVKARADVSIVLVEQSLGIAGEVADVVVFVQDGRTSPPEGVAATRDLANRMLFTGEGLDGERVARAREELADLTERQSGSLLTLDSVTVDIADMRALEAVTLSVPFHGIMGVIGPNGAGKTSLLNAICGYYPVSSGRIVFDGQDTTGVPSEVISRSGIRRSFQHAPALSSIRLVDYVSIGYEADRSTGVVLTGLPIPAAVRADAAAMRFARESLDDLSLGDYADRPLDDCPYAVRKLADVARAFLMSPRLVLLDEPTSGVADDQRPRIAEVIASRATATGASVVIVDHDVAFVTRVCETVAAMASGRLLDVGPTARVLANKGVIESFLGDLSSPTTQPGGSEAARDGVSKK